ncbi:hypothetical protein DRQ26_07140 [bacterium]|nr:MAG: hypothetical protein DRQ26_07140 [bacterium]
MNDWEQMCEDARWRVNFVVVSTAPNAFYIQTDINGETCTLSNMSDNGSNYHFEGYRGFYNLKELLHWFKTTRVGNITVNRMWMPSNALCNTEQVVTKSELIDMYPEVMV